MKYTNYFKNIFKCYRGSFIVAGIILFVALGNIFFSNIGGEIFYYFSRGDNSIDGQLINLDRVTTDITDIDQVRKELLFHEVKSGDTMWDIGESHNIELSDIFEINDLTEKSILRIGQKIILPSEDKLSLDINSEKIDFKSQAILVDRDSYDNMENNLEDDDRSEH